MKDANFDFSGATVVCCPNCESQKLKDYEKKFRRNKKGTRLKLYAEFLTCIDCGFKFNIYDGINKPFISVK